MGMQQWEYMIDVIPPGNKREWEVRLNLMGAEGWEAAAVWPQAKGLVVLLKKPK
jgi:hypothetical protein